MGNVYIALHVDTEGPLYESREELFFRVKEIFGIDLEPTDENLFLLQNKKLNLGGMEEEVAQVTDPHVIGFKGSWEQIDLMLDNILSPKYRNAMTDSAGGGWVYNWHIMDQVGYRHNPRRRDLGFFNVLDFYLSKLKATGSTQDGVHWHFHPVNFFGDANRCATSYTNSYPLLNEIISRRLIERGLFPRVNRAGFHSERPDGHWFLEQWIPFDPSNQSVLEDQAPKHQRDMRAGRFGDWRLAPSDWSLYHPHHDHYQLPGHCRRVIARVLNLKARHRSINSLEIKKAFEKARAGENVYLGLTNHDWREMAAEIDEFRALLAPVAVEYSDVPFFFSESVEAFQAILFPEVNCADQALRFSAKIEKSSPPRLVVEVEQGQCFGPQPWLAILSKGRNYYHDNFDLGELGRSFVYVFDGHTLELDEVQKLSVACNDKYGNQWVCHLEAGKDF
ncbi:MAG: hypothetical protein A2600_10735 [Candidatus Lambdaproteobacteria bacterium RIFOXYD1_FULL_56_27]|uniref:Uncharacterized protein n=1 Tax=Candidatus Lambdaproteobacteria bacterium RIFOXYD2_FULL_56_26 TaxID=1817773 RepID=A0A1F6GV99_9PROT|nr:MAG: hypothetical protein A2426_01555 [Candidatus Lambdaproteobacteria bacterium RIFOXYC1_FULL_56_13]OGH02055.1 MAG: hypothetical protein A2557_10455 [Candidatus Lambdaproteobacteria bacterium RIFOXYD2_FULL_56_26]OGH07705.1 MAG: hypothetical protein A2600_10735 [Candidatus Lambdaproteobacteria bacterium RIFOXYD1_FULL_56_27]